MNWGKPHRLFFCLDERGHRVELVSLRDVACERCGVTVDGALVYVGACTARGVDSALQRFRQLAGRRPADN